MTLFEYVKTQISITNVVSEYVKLKAAGNYLKGPCPFHSETEASFTVSPDKQIFYCFGCHTGGDVISFIANIENLSQIESTKHLVDRYNLEIPEHIKNSSFKKSEKIVTEKELWFKTCKAIANYCHANLLKNKTAKQYLNDRQITENEINTFKIGYLQGGINSINLFIKKMSQEGVLLKNLIDIGFLAQGRSIIYSSFEERILFPIKDSLGRYVGFGGRIFQPKDERAKYYNSKDGTFFTKGKLLFSLDLAKKEMKKTDFAYLVEGYTDCVAMFKHNYTNCVATLGTACTIDHLKLLSRYADNIVALYDGDQAGQKAILKMAQLCWDANLDLKVVSLPKKEDPASFLNDGKKLEEPCDIFSFFIDSIGQDFVNKSLSEKLKLSEKIVEAIAKIDNQFKRDLLLQKAAKTLQIDFKSLKTLMFQTNRKIKSTHKPQNSRPEGKTETSFPEFENVTPLEEKIFSAIINSIEKDEYFNMAADLRPYFNEKIQFLLNKLEFFVKKRGIDSSLNVFLDNLDDSCKKWVLHVSMQGKQTVSRDFFNQLLLFFRKSHWKQITKDTKLEIAKAKHNKDDNQLRKLLNEFSKLKQDMYKRGLI